LFIFILFIINLIALFFINGYFWVILAYTLWFFIISTIFLVGIIYFKKYKKQPEKKIKKIYKRLLTIMIIIILLIISIYSYPLFLLPVSHIRSETNTQELKSIVSELIKGAKTDEEKVQAILEWFNSSNNYIFNDYHLWRKGVYGIKIWPRGQFKIYLGEPYFGVRTFSDDDSLWILTSRYGHCGEYGLIFRDMANAAGLTVTKVTCSGEDHDWNEVQINNNWIVIDATRVGSAPDNGYNVSYDFMEKKVAGDRGTINGNVSYIEAEYPNGTKLDVTSKYTDMVNVTIFIYDENRKPVQDATITIYSNNRYDFINTEKRGIITNESGQCTFSIGSGEYTIQAKTNDIIPLFGEIKDDFFEDTITHSLSIGLKQDISKSILFDICKIILLIFVLSWLINKMRTYYLQSIVRIGLFTEKHRHEFIITLLSFFGVWIINQFGDSNELLNIILLLLFLIPLICILFSSKYVYEPVKRLFVRLKFHNPKIGIIDGRIDEKQSFDRIGYSKDYIFLAWDWQDKLNTLGIETELIPATEKFEKYSMVINPFGGVYIEEDIGNLKTLSRIKKYIDNGGIFINGSDLAFWKPWDSKDNSEGYTSLPVKHFVMTTNPFPYTLSFYMKYYRNIKLVPFFDGYDIFDTWLSNNFGVRTTCFQTPTIQTTISNVGYLNEMNNVDINEFRSALNSEDKNTRFFGLISARLDDRHESYLVATVHQKIGYLILFGIAITENGNEFEFVCRTIKLICDRLAEKGNF
jgi:hypothetical protein